MKIIIGLGNPEKKYDKTRHNAGFEIINFLQKKFDFPRFKLNKKLQAEICQGQFQSQKIILAKPQTFINNSGRAVTLLKNFYKLKPSEIIIVRDDIDLEFGKIRIKQNSGSGGHQGINSIIEHLGTNEFKQVKIGLKNVLATKVDASKFVLANFSSTELKEFKKIKNEAMEYMKKIL